MNHKGTKSTKESRSLANYRSRQVIGAAIEVHRILGPGLLESVYEEAMHVELMTRCIPCRRQVGVPVVYKGLRLDAALKLDLLVDEVLVVELKATRTLLPIHDAQLLTYLRLTGIWLGLIFNFNAVSMRDGIRRLVSDE